ncbi:hypothetical protein, variant 1 [Aphanomyces astaci]|uniref:START domain-containing protein n=1 Tax=Aphanomyces astaci TaxID=112090 RepID=W4GSC9_APHAT|nr:hypothetical protein, variant 1 [Aphanomyces astaci]ETV82241.1 hypothetical protein, variant 1 [Aphanomyces astaci]|eukprot:XP_009827910.1 hypothetical protein, variant 1 [Aphanomyces astaci]
MAPIGSSSRPHFPLHTTWTTGEGAHLRSTATAAFDALLEAVTASDHVGRNQTKHSRNHTQLVLPGIVTDVAAFFLDALDASDSVYCDRNHIDDTELLYVLKPRTMDQPLRFMGLRWSRFGAPLLCRPRDVCVVEYMDAFVDERGRRGWATCMQSVCHPSCPDFKPHHGLVRSTVHLSGYVAIESDVPGVIDVHVVLDWNFGMPPWARNAALAKRLQGLDKLDAYLKLKSLDHRPRHQQHVTHERVADKASHHNDNHDPLRRALCQGDMSTSAPSFHSQPSNLTFASSPSMRTTMDDDFNGATFDSLHIPSHCGVCQAYLRHASYMPCQLCDKVEKNPGSTGEDLCMNMNLCLLCDQTMLPTPPAITPSQQHRPRRTRPLSTSSARKNKTSPRPTSISDGVVLLDLSYLNAITSSASRSTDVSQPSVPKPTMTQQPTRS